MDTVVLVHGLQKPCTTEWQAFEEALVSLERPRVVVFTDGPSPDRSQVRSLRLRLDRRSLWGSLLTRSMKARILARAVAWSGVAVRAFAPDEVLQALAHLEIPEASYATYLRAGLSARASLAGLVLDDPMTMTMESLTAHMGQTYRQFCQRGLVGTG